MLKEKKPFMRGFGYALRGLWGMVRRERHFRCHLCATYYVTAFAVLYDLERTGYAVLFVTIFLVLALETVNTVVEAVVDMKSQRHTKFGRFAKDAAAGGVLLAAVGAIGVAVSLFCHVDKLAAAWQTLIASPGWMCAFAVPVIPCILFIVGRKKWNKAEEDEYL